MTTYKQLLTDAAAIGENTEGRDQALRRLCDDQHFPALLHLVQEFEEDLTASLTRYDRTAEERTMDAGGLATMRRLREVIAGILTPAPAETTEEQKS